MKLKLLCFLGGLFIMAGLFMASSGGRAATVGWGNTGAPGEETMMGQPTTCQTCHSSSTTVQVELGIEVTNANGEVVTGYAPR